MTPSPNSARALIPWLLVLATFLAPRAGADPRGAVDYQKLAAASAWGWSDEKATPLYCLSRPGNKYDVHLVSPHDKRSALIIRIFRGKRKVYECLGHPNSVFRILRDRLYYARFLSSASGGEVVAEITGTDLFFSAPGDFLGLPGAGNC